MRKLKYGSWNKEEVESFKKELGFIKWNDYLSLYNAILRWVRKRYGMPNQAFENVLRVVCDPELEGVIVDFRFQLRKSEDCEGYASVNNLMRYPLIMSSYGIVFVVRGKRNLCVRLNPLLAKELLKKNG